MRLQCDFCYLMCSLKEGQRGVCGIRVNQAGKLITLGYGELVASAIDPIEKKPFYHFLPASSTLSVALFGCNYRCKFCQNYHISQGERVRGKKVSPPQLAQALQESGTPTLSFTYSEPVVWLDYVEASAKEVKQNGGYNCMITNGSFSKSSLERVLPYIDAFNIDLKGDDLFYREYCKGRLQPVLDSIETISRQKDKVLEVTTLLIEGIHTEEHLKAMADQLVERGVQVWHLSRFYPQYQMRDHRQTSESYLLKLLELANEFSIPYIYAGNSNLREWERTSCPSCNATIVTSHNYPVKTAREIEVNLDENLCRQCGFEIYGTY